MTESDRAVHVQAAAVGPSVRDHLRHARDELAVRGLRGIAIQAVNIPVLTVPAK